MSREGENDLLMIDDPAAAAVLLQPLRLRILREAATPSSPTAIGARLDLSRQKAHYHVQALARAGFLRKAGRRRRRNMIEQLWVATARHYSLAPGLLGDLGVDRGSFDDPFSVPALIGLLARAQGDAGAIASDPALDDVRLPALSLSADFRFESPLQRAAFTQSLQEALAEVIARHTIPSNVADDSASSKQSFRLVVGSFPTSGSDEASP